MGMSPINSQLANLEYMLYGGASGANANVPSMYNGYMANFNSYNPAFMGGYGAYGYNPVMSGYYNPSIFNPQTVSKTAAGVGAAATAASGADAVKNISEQDWDVLAEYATKVNEGGETFGGALFSGLTFAAMENAQNTKHWKFARRGMQDANKIFDIKNNANIKALWEGKETRAIMQDAYSQAQAAYRRLYDKKGWYSQMFARNLSPADKKTVGDLLKKLENALKAKDEKAIIEITQKLKAARGIDGRIMTPFNAIFGKENLSAQARIDKKGKEIATGIKEAKGLSIGTKFMKEFKGWFLFESVIEGVTKVLPAYMDGGSDSGNKQLVQSGAKAAASAAGWSAGRLAGGVLGAKAGAAIGTAFGPGIGTAVGSVIGFACGCVGSWLAGKGIKLGINAIWGKEEADKLAEAKMKKSEEGKAELLQLAYQKAMSGEAPDRVVNSLQNVMKKIA